MKRITKILSFVFAVVMVICCVPSEITASAASYNWAASWGTPAIESGIVLGEDEDGLHLQDFIPAGSSIRTTVTPTLSGTKIRLKFSNCFSPDEVTINETTIAKTGETDDVVLKDTITQVTFNGGQKSIKIAPGSEVYSDEITFPVKALEKVSITYYFKNTTSIFTEGLYGGVSYLASSLGNRTHNEDMTIFASRLTFTSNTITYYTIPFLTRLDVYAKDAYSVVLLGDSTVTNDLYLMLAEKLQSNGITNVGVVMSGIIGNALLSDGTGLLGKVYGESLLERAKRDAFDVAGAKYVIIKIGVNDILHPMLKSHAGEKQVSAAEVIQGYRDLSKQAQGNGIKLYLCTRTPYKGYTRNFMGSDDLEWTQAGEDTLLEINSWVENNSDDYYDGYIDLDAVRDPKDSAKLRTHMTSDGVHFTEYGQIAVTDLIPEEALGINRELTDYSTLLGIDPYVAPVTTTPSKQESTTKNNGNSGNSNNNNAENNNAAENTTAKIEAATTVTQQESTTLSQNGIISSVVVNQETPTSSANQILVEDPDSVVVGNVSDAGSKAARQMAGFAILAAVSMAIIAVSSVMLIRMTPASKSLTRGGYGRAKQKKRV